MSGIGSAYEPLYIRLATKGKVTFRLTKSTNLESIRVGWYSWKRQNELILGPKSKHSLTVESVDLDGIATLKLVPKTNTELEIEIL